MLKVVFRTTLAWLGASVLLAYSPNVARAQRTVDSSFAGVIARLSESGGYFDSDNIISNEASYLQIASQLTKVGVHGGVYIGVGPDQNFSYIALIRPRVAFMLDVRRDNMMEHLLFKSLFVSSRNRLEYLLRLFGKAVPPDIESWTGRSTSEILAAFADARLDSQTVAAARRLSNERIARFGVPLTAHDREMIDRYRSAFVSEGLDTRYSSIGRNNRGDYPSFGRLMMETDRAGRQISYLADENAFQFVRTMQINDRIIPVVGNVAGDKALKAIGQYATERGLNVSAFYLSNVEQFLEQDNKWNKFCTSVSTLSLDDTSVFIRSGRGANGFGGGVQNSSSTRILADLQPCRVGAR